MSTVFVEFSKPYMAPGGGVMNTGEIASIDPVTAATLIANGTAVSSGAPPAYVPPSLTRVKFVATAMETEMMADLEARRRAAVERRQEMQG